jgi:hypothetical protein
MIALGILNEQYEPGEPAYGIPRPGAFIVNLDNEIVGKIFIDSHRERVDGEGTLRYALEVLE